MMKKLLTIILISAAGVTGSYAQCTPDISCIPSGTTYGICPDSATGMAMGTVGVAYNQVMSMKVPSTSAGFSTGLPFAVPVTSIKVDSVTGLAPGLSYVCSPAGCTFPGGTNGCILISGTPTAVWNQQVTVYATATVSLAGPQLVPQTNSQYRSIVNAPAGIEMLDMSKFDVKQNMPNPFSSSTEIQFSSVTPETVEFSVFNMLGSVVYSKTIKAEKGANTITLDASVFPEGIYMYSLKNGSKTITKRMIVTK
ncbi:MAG: hypothetical protein JWP12_1729 [Bacteroidetes bacterium]|nr:hypothetical protein [Bacteroidota bacterium]